MGEFNPTPRPPTGFMTKPTVTVLIDTYNHERFIEEAIVSVLEQDFPGSEMEILVVDDGSTDRTPDIVRKFEPRLRLMRKENGGQASAFNAGIPEARGEFVTFLDGDDWWAKNKLSRVVEALSADPAIGMVGHGIAVVHRDGTQQTEILREGFRFRANTLEGALLFRLRKSLLGTSRMTLRRDLLRRIGTVPEELRIEADEYLFTLAAILAETEILPDVLTFYRMHDSNAFQILGDNLERAHQRKEILLALVSALSGALSENSVGQPVRDALLGVLQAELDQARLMLEGGWSWETAKTEWTLYRILSPRATLPHRMFKLGTSFIALFLPPRTFYRWRALATKCERYRRVRQAIFPKDHPQHVEHQTARSCGS